MIIFLKKFKLIYDNIKIKAKIKARRILEYYKNDVIRELKEFNKWKIKDQNKLKTKILKK